MYVPRTLPIPLYLSYSPVFPDYYTIPGVQPLSMQATLVVTGVNWYDGRYRVGQPHPSLLSGYWIHGLHRFL